MRRRRRWSSGWRVRPVLLLFLGALLLAPVQSQEDLNAEEEEAGPAPEFVFGLPGQETEASIQQVITGDLRLQGQFAVTREEEFRLIVSNTLSKICENKSLPVWVESVVDIGSFQSLRPEFVLTWAMLPPLGGGQYCMDSFAMVSYGNVEPPFDEVIGPPPFRELLQIELKAYTPTMLVRVANWKIALANISCDFRYVVAPIERVYTRYTTTAPPGGTEKPPEACMDGDPLMPKWIPPDKQSDPLNVQQCTFATNACGCTVFANCTWRANPGGGFWCQPALPDERVTCAQCSLQEDCPLSAGDICAMTISPCACAASRGDCRWDLDIQTCVPRQGGETLCAACTAQRFCTRPHTLGVQPFQGGDMLERMGDPQVGWVANITFDRSIFFDERGAEYGVHLACRSTLEQFYRELHVPRKAMKIFTNETATMLQIDTYSIVNDRMRECNVVVGDEVVRDRDFVYYAGMEMAELAFLLPDSVRPSLKRFSPPNSQVGVQINFTVTLVFDEAVMGANGSSVVLMQLGGEWEGGREGAADEVVAVIELDDARAMFNRTNLTLNLRGLIDTFVLYSIAVPAGAVVDLAGNPWAGIDVGFYNFRTQVQDITPEEEVSEEENLELYIAIGVGAVGGAACVLATGLALFRTCQVRMKARQKQLGTPSPLKNPAPDPLTQAAKNYSKHILKDLDKKEKLQMKAERKSRIRASQVAASVSVGGSSPRSSVVSPTSRMSSMASPKSRMSSPSRSQVLAWPESPAAGEELPPPDRPGFFLDVLEDGTDGDGAAASPGDTSAPAGALADFGGASPTSAVSSLAVEEVYPAVQHARTSPGGFYRPSPAPLSPSVMHVSATGFRQNQLAQTAGGGFSPTAGAAQSLRANARAGGGAGGRARLGGSPGRRGGSASPSPRPPRVTTMKGAVW